MFIGQLSYSSFKSQKRKRKLLLRVAGWGNNLLKIFVGLISVDTHHPKQETLPGGYGEVAERWHV